MQRVQLATGDAPGRLPLYRLPELAKAERVYVVEGEKCAEALWSVGLVATTCAHGAKSAHKTDWTPLAGKEVIIWPDNDSGGRKYLDDVSLTVGKLTPPPKLKPLEVEGLDEGGDVVDWLDAQGDAADPNDFRDRIEAMANCAADLRRHRGGRHIEPFEPFPVRALPQSVRHYVVETARAIGCNQAQVAVLVLAALAAAIGNSRRIRLKRKWTEPAIMWAAVVAYSGDKKSPPLEAVMEAIRERQRVAQKDYEKEMVIYERDRQLYERDLKAWQRSKGNDPPPQPPIAPNLQRYWCDDVTIEAMAVLLQSNPRGLLLIPDELSGWLGGFDRYSNGRGNDVAKWLEMFGGRAIAVDRKTGDRKTIFVRNASVSVAGTIQPDTLRRALGEQHRQNGMAARLLLTWPPRRPQKWTDADVSQSALNAMGRLFDRLFTLDMDIDTLGEFCPVILDFTEDGQPGSGILTSTTTNKPI